MEAIPIFEVTTGRSGGRPRESLTLDIPLDLDPAASEVSVDAAGLVHYTSAGGTPHVLAAHLTELGTRHAGQLCLVGDAEIEPGGADAVRRYRLCEVGGSTAA